MFINKFTWVNNASKRLFYYKFPGRNLVLLENSQYVNTGIQIGEIQFLAKNGRFHYSRTENIEYHYLFRGIALSSNIDLTACYRIWIEVESLYIPS